MYNYDLTILNELDKELWEKQGIIRNNAEAFKLYVVFAINRRYKEGLKSNERNIFIGIEKKLKDVIKNENQTLEFNNIEHILIRNCVNNEDLGIPPDDAFNFSLVQEVVNQAKFEKSA